MAIPECVSVFLYGVCRQVVKASGCDSDMRGFDPHQTPQIFLLTDIRDCATIALFFKKLSGCVT